MNKTKIRKLAEITFENGKVNKKVAEFSLKKLNKTDLKIYLNYLKINLGKNKIYIKTADSLTKDIKDKIKIIFKDKEIVWQEDKSIGAGAIIKRNDDIIDLSIKGYINRSVNELKNTL